jgi:hypothetical protein
MNPIRVAQVTFDYNPFDVRVRRLAEAAVDDGCAAGWADRLARGLSESALPAQR